MAGKTLEESIVVLEQKLEDKKTKLAKKQQRDKAEERRARNHKIYIVGSSLLTDASLHQDRLDYLLGALRRSVVKDRDKADIADILSGDLSGVVTADKKR